MPTYNYKIRLKDVNKNNVLKIIPYIWLKEKNRRNRGQWPSYAVTLPTNAKSVHYVNRWLVNYLTNKLYTTNILLANKPILYNINYQCGLHMGGHDDIHSDKLTNNT